MLQFQLKGEQGQSSAQFQAGCIFHDQRHEYAEAERWWRRAAAQHHILAMHRLAQLLRFGKGAVVRAQPDQSAAFSRLAAERGFAASQFALAVALEEGEGVQRDVEQALTWYRRAAEQKFPGAQVGFENLNLVSNPSQFSHQSTFDRRPSTVQS